MEDVIAKVGANAPLGSGPVVKLFVGQIPKTLEEDGVREGTVPCAHRRTAPRNCLTTTLPARQSSRSLAR